MRVDIRLNGEIVAATDARDFNVVLANGMKRSEVRLRDFVTGVVIEDGGFKRSFIDGRAVGTALYLKLLTRGADHCNLWSRRQISHLVDFDCFWSGVGGE